MTNHTVYSHYQFNMLNVIYPPTNCWFSLFCAFVLLCFCFCLFFLWPFLFLFLFLFCFVCSSSDNSGIITTGPWPKWYKDNSVPGHLGTEHMSHFGTRYWTFRYSVLDVSVLNERQIGTSKEVIIWLNLKTYFVFFLHLDVVYTNLYVVFF